MNHDRLRKSHLVRPTIPVEILKKVKLLEINTRKLVNHVLLGEYHSAFKGQGMVFSEFREYVHGDDVRAISWTLSARTGKPYIKKFDEERELTLILAVDVSGSIDFGSGALFKGEALNHLAALLSLGAVKNGDHVGLLLFSDQVEHFVPPKKGRGHIHRILRDLYYYQPKSRKTNISVALQYLLGILKKRSTVFIFSDFLDSGFSPAMRMVERKHDLVAVVVQDQSEIEFPDIGLVECEDSETGELIIVDSSSAAFQESFKKSCVSRRGVRDREFRKTNVERIEVLSNQDVVDPLLSFFRMRQKK